MESVGQKGKLPRSLTISPNNEIKILIDGFNKMIDDIGNLIKTVELKEKNERRLEISKLQSELDLLQLQMNPHFIHNTLNAISFLSMKHETHDITEMIDSFNLLLR